MGEELIKTENNQEFDICYSVDENTWNGTTSIQLRLKGSVFKPWLITVI